MSCRRIRVFRCPTGEEAYSIAMLLAEQSEHLPDASFYSVFCDSIEELNRIIGEVETGELKTEFLGVRLRTPNIQSRFGIAIDTPETFETLVEAIRGIRKTCKFGVHFYMARANVGVGNRWHFFESMLRWCASIEALSGRLIEILDVGYCWFPEDLQENAGAKFRRAIEMIPNFCRTPGAYLANRAKLSRSLRWRWRCRFWKFATRQTARRKSSLTVRLPNCRCISFIRTEFCVRTAKTAIGNL